MVEAAFTPPFIAPANTMLNCALAIMQMHRNVVATWPPKIYTGRFHKLGFGLSLYVMDADAIHEILVTKAEHFPQGPIFRRIIHPIWRGGIADSEGEDWRWQRRASSPVFSPSATRAVVPHAARAAELLAARWAQTPMQDFNISPGLADAATHVVFDALLAGGFGADRTMFLEAAEALSAELGVLNIADALYLPEWTRPLLGPTLKLPAEKLHTIIADIFHNLPEDLPQNSLLNLLAHATDSETGQRMPRELVKNNSVGLLAAGRDTTAITIGWALWLLAHCPEILAQLQDEIAHVTKNEVLRAEHLDLMPLAKAVIMETLRLYPPGAMIVRYCAQDMHVQDQFIRKGQMIIIPIYALQRRADTWKNPNQFIPVRFIGENFKPREMRYAYMPFGGGGRMCLGMSFALMEAQSILVTLLQKLDIAKAACPPRIEFEIGATLRPRDGLFLRVAPRA